jgi:methylmalonyl-CoA mutase C-terminal domain/subunit
VVGPTDSGKSLGLKGTMRPPIRVLLGKVGLDTHDRGIKLVALWLRDAGMEVSYIGPYHTPEDLAAVAAQEDVDVVGVSFLDGGHLGWSQDLLTAMADRKAGDIPIVVGGTVSSEDRQSLMAEGIFDVAPPGTPLTAVVAMFERAAMSRRRTA